MTTFPEPQLALALQPLHSDNIVMQDFCARFDGQDISVVENFVMQDFCDCFEGHESWYFIALVLQTLHIDNKVMRDSVSESDDDHK